MCDFRRDDVLRLLRKTSDTDDDLVGAQWRSPATQPAIIDHSTLTLDELFAHTRKQMAVRERRQLRIVARIRRSGAWISLEDVADWFAREKGSIEPDERLRAKAFRQLGDALTAGEFGFDRRSRVLFLHPRSNWAKMTPERLDMVPFDDEGRSSYLRHCWVPSDLAAAWFDRRNLAKPRHLFPPTSANKAQTGQPQEATMGSIQFDSGYISPFFITNVERGTAELADPFILIHAEKLSIMWPLLKLIESILESGKPLLVVAGDIEGDVLAFLVANKRSLGLKVAGVRAPAFGDCRRAILEDIATFTGGLLVNRDLGITLDEITPDMLGTAKRVFVEKNKTTILGGGGKNVGKVSLTPEGTRRCSSGLDEVNHPQQARRGRQEDRSSDRRDDACGDGGSRYVRRAAAHEAERTGRPLYGSWADNPKPVSRGRADEAQGPRLPQHSSDIIPTNDK